MIDHLTAKLIQMSDHLTAKTMSTEELSLTGMLNVVKLVSNLFHTIVFLVIFFFRLVISDRPNPEHVRQKPNRTEPSAEIGHIYRTRSAVLAEHS